MNSETKIIVKMIYAKSVCHTLLKHSQTIDAVSTIEWMVSRSEEVMDDILGNVPPKQARSWARVADRCIERLRSLKQELSFSEPGEIDLTEEILYTISVLTQMLSDVAETNKSSIIEDMLTAAYTLEEVLGLSNKKKGEATLMKEDEIRSSAAEFIDHLYRKMDAEY